jgi:hypothetical protein
MRSLMILTLASLAAITAAGCGTTGLGQGVRDDVNVQMAKTKSPIAKCYAKALAKDRKLRGRMQLAFYAEAKTGKFIGINIDRNEVADADLAACVTAEVGKLKLDKPAKSKVEIHYPLDFLPDDLVGQAPPAPPAPAAPPGPPTIPPPPGTAP